ncbi:unnamed protein product [Prunus armeniaca]|uniref:Legume lectin domain-containing protein n=1 Tax=Prunus armeniaca TaxID=36596 RepID=A0A6J5X8M8_PRUAR|nr:unnamed protein product [Prunus armeniaca]
MVFNNHGKGIIPLHSPKLMFLLLLFFLFNPSATPLTFNFPSFSNVTTNPSRALLILIATSSDSPETPEKLGTIDNGHADGMVFFVAPNGTLLNSAAGGGGKLGLPVDDLPGDTTKAEYPFVAVEFDIFKNTVPTSRDPCGDRHQLSQVKYYHALE